MVAAVAAHEDGVAIAAAMGATQVGVNDIIHPGNFGADQGGFDGYFSDVHVNQGRVGRMSGVV